MNTIDTGVYLATKKNGELYYRSSISYKNKHISLGSYTTYELANLSYLESKNIVNNKSITFESYPSNKILPFEKVVILFNFRDNGYYFRNPIYMHKYYFSYFLTSSMELKFDVDDLFYYSNHKIFLRNGYLFVNDYGMQVNILSRYGIKNFAVKGKDYIFKDGDNSNFRYHNIEIINPYYGVSKEIIKGTLKYTAKIHINGNYIIGRFNSLNEAAIAYNKAVDYVVNIKGINKKYTKNYIENVDNASYIHIYNNIKLPNKIINLN